MEEEEEEEEEEENIGQKVVVPNMLAVPGRALAFSREQALK